MTHTSHPKVWVTLGLALALALAASLLAASAQAAFPGKNGKIAFAMDDSDDLEIFTVNHDGTGLKQLTDNGASDDDPSFSPDGKRIVFESDRANPNGIDDVFVMNADGSNQRNLTKTRNVFDANPAFSPSGKKVAFEGEDPTTFNGDIFTIRTDGSDQENVTDSPDEDDNNPSWGSRR